MMILKRRWLLLSSLLATFPCDGAVGSDGEGRWAGFQGGGTSEATQPLPAIWNPESEKIRWTCDVHGYGQSSPVLNETHAFVTSTSGEKKEGFHITAINLATGEKVWRGDLVNPTPEENNNYVSRAAPTPVLDGERLFVANEGGLVAALSVKGPLIWQRDLVAEFGPITARHGLASSLEMDESRVFVWIEREQDPYLLAIDKNSGQTLWKVAGLGSTTWGSPRLITVGQTQHLVCSASGVVAGFDPETGNRLWELRDIANNTSTTPMPAGEGRFFLGVSDGRGEAAEGGGANSSGLVQIEVAADGSSSAKFLWRADRARTSFGSPLVAAGKVWVVNRSGALFQLNLETGETIGTTRLAAGSIWATPIYTNGRVYFFGQKGTTSVVSAETGEELESGALWNDASDEAAGTPGFSGHIQYAAASLDGWLVIRRGDKVYGLRDSAP